MNSDRLNYEKLCTADCATLERIMKNGLMPDPEKLAGWEFNGFNTLDLTSILGFRKFKKGFYRNPESKEPQALWGYNVKILQNPLMEEWVDVTKKEQPVYHGFYKAYPAPAMYANALLIDYGAGGNKPYDPTGLLRDYLVKIYYDNDDLYLGKAFLAVELPSALKSFGFKVFVSYFILNRNNKSNFLEHQ